MKECDYNNNNFSHFLYPYNYHSRNISYGICLLKINIIRKIKYKNISTLSLKKWCQFKNKYNQLYMFIYLLRPKI